MHGRAHLRPHRVLLQHLVDLPLQGPERGPLRHGEPADRAGRPGRVGREEHGLDRRTDRQTARKDAVLDGKPVEAQQKVSTLRLTLTAGSSEASAAAAASTFQISAESALKLPSLSEAAPCRQGRQAGRQAGTKIARKMDGWRLL
eukprot:SAG22_NODE_85_length_21510_cov_6.472187_8_plen_145_part_00